MGVGGQSDARAALPPGKISRCPLCRRMNGPQGRSGRVRNNSPHWEWIPRPSRPQRVARYTNIVFGGNEIRNTKNKTVVVRIISHMELGCTVNK
jgi:hypothetical protein